MLWMIQNSMNNILEIGGDTFSVMIHKANREKGKIERMKKLFKDKRDKFREKIGIINLAVCNLHPQQTTMA